MNLFDTSSIKPFNQQDFKNQIKFKKKNSMCDNPRGMQFEVNIFSK